MTGGILHTRVHAESTVKIIPSARRSADAGRRRLMRLTSRPIQWADLHPAIVLASERAAQSVAQAVRAAAPSFPAP